MIPDRWAPRHRVLVLPTRFGLAFVSMAVLTLIGCINYQLSLGYAFTFLLLSVWVTATIHASRALSGLTAHAHDAEATFAGAPLLYPVTLTGPGRAPVTVRSGPHHVTLHDWSDGAARGLLHVPTTHRGAHHLLPLQLRASDPLGLWQARLYLHASASAVVYPTPERSAPPYPVMSTDTGAPNGADRDASSVRPFRTGDSARRVAWRASARRDTLLTRDGPAGHAAQITLHWDDTRAAGPTEARLSRLCAWVLRAQTQQARTDLHLPGAAPTGPVSADHALRLLALSALADT